VASYKLLIKTSAGKEIAAVASALDRARIVGRIESLTNEPRPRGCEKLAGFDDRYRVRQDNCVLR